MASKQNDYTAENIQVLEGLEPVRKRPGMYIGSTDEKGLHQLFKEIVDNSVDEALVGYGNKIYVTINVDGSVTVEDEGRGIPTDINPKHKISGVELAMTRLHAGGKFDAQAYAKSGGLHGVGAAATNALSTQMIVEVKQKGKLFRQTYKKGIPDGPLKEVGKATTTGTKTTFYPDPEIFSTVEWNYKIMRDELRNWAYLVPKLYFSLKDARTGEEFSFYFEGGIKSLVAHMNSHTHPISDIFYVSKEVETTLAPVGIEVALQYNDEFGEKLSSFVNIIETPDGGTHVAGFRSALTRSINEYGKKIGAIKEGQESFIGDDLKEGLTAVIYVKMAADKLQFESQTKTKLNNAEIQPAVAGVVKEALDMFFEENPRDGRAIMEKVFLAAKARLAARAAKDAVIRKGALEGSALPGKLADCQSRDPKECELYIVEGDSAGGCFDGNTKVALADGRNLSFIELEQEQHLGKVNYCYTINELGRIALEKITNVRQTKKSATVIKINLDNGEEIVCTPDHLFMLKNGDYKKAAELTANDSLMPLYRQVSKLGQRITIEGYEMVFDPKENRWLFTHMLANDYNLKNHRYSLNSGSHRHHLDFNKRNNNPDNLILLDEKTHLDLHRNHAKLTLGREDVKEKLRKIRQTPEFRKKMHLSMSTPEMIKQLSSRAKKQWTNKSYKEFMLQKFLAFYQSHPNYQKQNNLLLNLAQKKHWSDKKNCLAQSERTKLYYQNHPDQKLLLSQLSKIQWTNESLLAARAEMTKKQWTPEFRIKRKSSYNQTYLTKALQELYKIYQDSGIIDKNAYNKVRIETNDKSLLKLETITKRFFDNDSAKLRQAVYHFNHRIKSITTISEKRPVYDLEVPGTHNFALASGIFVHNSAKQGRDRKFQAILPLFGKPLNTERSRIDQIVDNDKFKSLIIAIGAGIADQFNIEKLRYHRIIIMADADVDGSHIATLYMTLFYRHLPQLLTGGHIYIAMPPLYKLEWAKEKKYVYTEDEKDKFVATLGSNVKLNVQRYKGLGEMNAEELWETTLNPANRVLKQVTVGDAASADEVFRTLMGDEVPPRKRFIQSHAKSANLDI